VEQAPVSSPSVVVSNFSIDCNVMPISFSVERVRRLVDAEPYLAWFDRLNTAGIADVTEHFDQIALNKSSRKIGYRYIADGVHDTVLFRISQLAVDASMRMDEEASEVSVKRVNSPAKIRSRSAQYGDPAADILCG
jgi:hypothetical protein